MLAMVWARSRDDVIGRDGTLPWHLPEDLAHFRRLTGGHPVVMGRRTWDSLPERFRPLPGRENVVLTRDPDLTVPGAVVVRDVAGALAHVAGRDAWVIGGGTVYAALEPHADRCEVTDVDVVVGEGTRGPVLGTGWAEVGDPPAWSTSSSGLRYRFRTFGRVGRPVGGGGDDGAAGGSLSA